MIEGPHLWLIDPDPDPGGPKTRGSEFGSGSATLDSRVHKTTYAPMIYTAQCVMLLMRADTSRGSVADPGCLSRIPDPDFYPSRIPDPKTATKERGEKKLVVIPIYVATNFTKL